MYPYHDALCHSLKLACEVYETMTLVAEDCLDGDDVEAMIKAIEAFNKNIPDVLRGHPFAEHVKSFSGIFDPETTWKHEAWEPHQKLEATLVSFIEAAVRAEYPTVKSALPVAWFFLH